jgi:hypothetical protein
MKKTRSARGRSAVTTRTDSEVVALTDPHIEQLREDFEFTLNERDSSLFTRMKLNYETRHCVWPGQSQDGRKWTTRRGEDQVFPWPGASDARVFLVDKYIKKHVAMLLALDSKMRVRVNATEVNDEGWATRMTNYLRWLKTTQMTERRAENELLANYMLERGAAIMSTLWCKKTQLQYEVTDREAIAALAIQKIQEGDQRFVDLPGMLFDATFAAEAAVLLADLFPDVPKARLEKVAQDIALTGEATFPRPAVVMNRPKVIARCPNEDIFISPDASSLDEANAYEVEVMRESKFKSYAKEYGWNEEWTAEVLETQQGVVEFGNLQFNLRNTRQWNAILPTRGATDARKLFLVVHGYRCLVDAEGVPGIFYTVFHPHVSENVAKHELLNYAHGQLPHTLFCQERRSRRMDDSRGYGEIASTAQQSIKNQWDMRQDRSSIATLPPSYHPTGMAPDKWGPGVQVPTNTPDRYGFMEVPGYDRGSKEEELTVQQFTDDYFGFNPEPEAAMDALNLKQKLADDWMFGHMQVDTQILQLSQQFTADEFYFRVVGSSQGKPIKATREEIQGKFDLSVGFDIGDLDPELKKAKLDGLSAAYAFDATGQIDRGEGLMVALDIIDPNLSERLIKPGESASLQEAEDERRVFVSLIAGIPVMVKPGQAYQLRMQTLTETFQQNEYAQQLYANNKQTKDAFDKRMKDLQQAFQNAPGGPNAVIGRGGPAFKPKMISEG